MKTATGPSIIRGMDFFNRLKRARPPSLEIRDDNLRLIFAVEQQRLLDEHLRDISTGAVLLVIFVAASAAFNVALFSVHHRPVSPLADEGIIAFIFGILTAAAGFVWAMALVAALLSPLIAALLFVEYLRTKRKIAEHRAFLASYNRL